MADVDGDLGERGVFGQTAPMARPLRVITDTSGVPDQPRTYFKMIGWNTTWGAPETWVVEDAPSDTPPVGPCVNIEVSAVWDA